MKLRTVLSAVVATLAFNGVPAHAAWPWFVTKVVGGTYAIAEAYTQHEWQTEVDKQFSSSAELTQAQRDKVLAAITYLNDKGLTVQAAQLKDMLDRKLLRYQASAPGDKTSAITWGGYQNAYDNSGFIVLKDEFFNATNDGGVPIDSESDGDRFRAKTLVHELGHVNSQANVVQSNILNALWTFRSPLNLRNQVKIDKERPAFETHVPLMPQLGYTPDEIQTMIDTIKNGKNDVYKEFLPLFEDAKKTAQRNSLLPQPGSPAETMDGARPAPDVRMGTFE